MKVLCPIDFSEASVNACRWVVKYLNQYSDNTVHLLHCINIRSRSTIFLRIDDILNERAQDDIFQLKKELSSLSKNVKFDSTIVVFDPNSYIPEFASLHNFDMVVTGTKGLTALKDITVGSVTEAVIQKSKIPVLTIPKQSDYNDLKTIVLGVDDKLVLNEGIVSPLIEMCEKNNTELKMVHVKRKDDDIIQYDPSLDMYFRHLKYSYESLDFEISVSETLSEYCDSVNADMLCMIHRKKHWLERLFHRSFTKSELFHLDIPFLVLPTD